MKALTQKHRAALARAACEARPSYASAGAAVARYFTLRDGLGVAGSHPMNPDDTIKGTRTSTDRETLLEMLDLGRALHCAGVTEDDVSWWILCVEFTRADLPVSARAGTPSKLAVLRHRCPAAAPLTEATYLVRLAQVLREVRTELEHRRWIPRRPSQQTPPSHPNR